jgi:hypothetical protein
VSPNTGTDAGGVSVTVTGTGFTGVPSVTFGGVAATSVVVVNAGQLTCVTPAHADGAVTVAVGAASLGNAYTFAAFPTPDLLSNASFENDAGGIGWSAGDLYSGFRTGSNGLEPSGVGVRSTDVAKLGTTSLKFPWDHNAGDLSSQYFWGWSNRIDHPHTWQRTWFFYTAQPTAGFKFFRGADAGINNVSGVQMLAGGLIIIAPSGGVINWLGSGGVPGGLPSINTWHCLEYEFDYTNRQQRVWLNGVAQGDGGIQSGDPALISWAGTTATYTVPAMGTMAGQCFVDVQRIINPQGNAGAIYYDAISYSTLGRIGP